MRKSKVGKDQLNGVAHRLGVGVIDQGPRWSGGGAALTGAGKRKRFAARDVIYRESQPVARFHLIRGGLVKLLSYLPNGRARIVRLHSDDDWIGIEGLLGQPYQHTAIAVDDVEVEHFSIHGLQYLHRENARVLRQLLRQWHDDLVQADKWISDFSTGGIRRRVARLLEYLAELEYGHAADRVKLLTVHEMAEILGVTQESVSRVLAGFKRSNILSRQSGLVPEIYRLDTERLGEVA